MWIVTKKRTVPVTTTIVGVSERPARKVERTAVSEESNAGWIAPQSVLASMPRALAAQELVNRIVAAIEPSHRRAIGVSLHDRITGERFSYNGRFRTQTGSLVKPMILIALMRAQRERGTGLTPSQRRLADGMIRVSDNPAAATLLRKAGGRKALDRLAADLGMARTESSMSSWGRTLTTAPDQARFIDALVDGPDELGVSDSDREYLLDLMARVIPAQKWGVGAVPSGVETIVKNGWVPLSPGGWRVNTVGHVKGWERDYVLAILSSSNSSLEAGVGRVNAVSRTVFSALG